MLMEQASLLIESLLESSDEGGKDLILLQPMGKGASRSGAGFYMTRNKEFILKSVPRVTELEAAIQLKPRFEEYYEELKAANDPDFRRDMGSSRRHTNLNPILLTFQTVEGEEVVNWVLLPTASVKYLVSEVNLELNGEKVDIRTIDEKESITVGSSGLEKQNHVTVELPKMYDLKAWPMISPEREQFFLLLEALTDGKGLRDTWANYGRQLRTVLQDIDFVQKLQLVDYSILFLFAHVRITLPEAAEIDATTWNNLALELMTAVPRCAWIPLPSKGERSRDVIMMCTALIDYLMEAETFGMVKGIENKLVGGVNAVFGDKHKMLGWSKLGKWDYYSQKTEEMMLCIDDPCLKGRKRRITSTKRKYVVDGRIKVEHSYGCSVYRDLFRDPVSRGRCKLVKTRINTIDTPRSFDNQVSFDHDPTIYTTKGFEADEEEPAPKLVRESADSGGTGD